MCNNALKYNKNGTVYHKAARKLLHLGLRQLQPEKLRPLGNILTYMYEIPIRELGFDMGKMDVVSIFHCCVINHNLIDKLQYGIIMAIQFLHCVVLFCERMSRFFCTFMNKDDKYRLNIRMVLNLIIIVL